MNGKVGACRLPVHCAACFQSQVPELQHDWRQTACNSDVVLIAMQPVSVINDSEPQMGLLGLQLCCCGEDTQALHLMRYDVWFDCTCQQGS